MTAINEKARRAVASLRPGAITAIINDADRRTARNERRSGCSVHVVRLGCLTMRDCKVVQQSDRRPCVAMRSRQDTVDGWWAIHERGDCDCSLMVAAATAAVLEAWRGRHVRI
jgi:hypothetical protein